MVVSETVEERGVADLYLVLASDYRSYGRPSWAPWSSLGGGQWGRHGCGGGLPTGTALITVVIIASMSCHGRGVVAHLLRWHCRTRRVFMGSDVVWGAVVGVDAAVTWQVVCDR